ncbi:MAG: hypothetical protein ACKOA4_06940 [Haliscomenobacter sp.]
MRPFVSQKDRLPDTESQVVFPAQVGLIRVHPTDYPLKLFKELIAFPDFGIGALTGKPGIKSPKSNFMALRNGYGFYVFPERQKIYLLGVIAVAIRGIERGCIFYQKGGKSYIKDMAAEYLDFLEGKGCFPTPC